MIRTRLRKTPYTGALPALAATSAGLALLLTGCGEVTMEQSAEAESFTVTDDQGRDVTIDGPVERSVVINSYGNEFVRAIGAGDTVVGVDRTSLNRLPYLEVEEEAVIAEGLDQLNYEAIAELEPDVVILPRNAIWEEAATQLESFGIPVVVATAWDYAAFDDTVELLGEVFGEEEGADEVQAFNQEILDAVAEGVEGQDTVPVYLETVDPYLTVLPGSGFHALIEAAGGENVFADSSGGDAQEEITVDPADVVSRNPELIIHEFEPSAEPTGDGVFSDIGSGMYSRAGWSNIDAITEEQVYVANGWATSAVAKSIGAAYLATWLHPEQFEDLDPETYLQRWVEDFQGTEFSSDEDYIQHVEDPDSQ